MIVEVNVEGKDSIKGLIGRIRGGGEEVRRKGRENEREHSWVSLKEEENEEKKLVRRKE